jgi:hypothetical protein
MHFWNRIITAFAVVILLPSSALLAQAVVTDGRPLEPSVFGGFTMTQTGLNGGRNLSITSGIDVGIKAYRAYELSLEGRATVSIQSGTVVGENEALGGLRIERHMGHMHPYLNVLFGQGDLNYQSGGFRGANRHIYYKTDSQIVSVGCGAEFNLFGDVLALVDIQAQHWDSPVAPNGSIISFPIVTGFVYHLPGRKHGHVYP